jgi:hypothetical protein
MGISTRQTQHYRMLAEEEAARLTIIRALIRLAASSEDREAVTLALDRLGVTTSEISFAADESWSSRWSGLLAAEPARGPRGDIDRPVAANGSHRPSSVGGLLPCPSSGQSPPALF